MFRDFRCQPGPYRYEPSRDAAYQEEKAEAMHDYDNDAVPTDVVLTPDISAAFGQPLGGTTGRSLYYARSSPPVATEAWTEHHNDIQRRNVR